MRYKSQCVIIPYLPSSNYLWSYMFDILSQSLFFIKLFSFKINRLLDKSMIKSVSEIKMHYVKRMRHAQRSQEQITVALLTLPENVTFIHICYFYSLSQLLSIFLIRKPYFFLFVDFTACLFPTPTDARGPLKIVVLLATCSFSGINTNLFKSSLRAVSSSAATLRTLGLIPSVSYGVCYYTFYWSALKPLLLTLHFEAVFRTRFL